MPTANNMSGMIARGKLKAQRLRRINQRVWPRSGNVGWPSHHYNAVDTKLEREEQQTRESNRIIKTRSLHHHQPMNKLQVCTSAVYIYPNCL